MIKCIYCGRALTQNHVCRKLISTNQDAGGDSGIQAIHPTAPDR